MGGDVGDVRSEVVRRDADVELDRITFRQDGHERAVVLKRVPRERALEVRLLPFLARKSAHVQAVYARGIPPPAVPAKDWLLLEDTLGLPSHCDTYPPGVVAAKVAIEQAVAKDGPALTALGVPAIPPARIAGLAREAGAAEADDAMEAAARLASWPAALVHGDLTCANAVTADHALIVEWRWAYLGCALLDVVRLTADLVDRGDAVLGIGLSRVYGELTGRTIGSDELRAAELLERLFSRYVRD